MFAIEIVGYIASFFVAISLLSVSIVRLRILNLIGCVAFVIYAYLIKSIPTGVANAFILGINIVHLYKLFNKNISTFSYLPISQDRRGQVEGFLNYYKEDVKKHFPLFDLAYLDAGFSEKGRVFLALKELKAVGCSFYAPVKELPASSSPEEKEILDYVEKELYPESTAYLVIDYIEKKYRNIGVDQKLYNRIASEISGDIQFLVAPGQSNNKANHKFMSRNGYKVVKNFGEYSLYLKNLGTN